MTQRAAGEGIVYLVGAGPGDPGLITRRGAELLATCDAVVHDALANPQLLALATANGRDVELHDVGKRGGSGDSARQDDINALLVRLGRDGKRVVRLKGGDPFVFGRGSEEAQALRDGGVEFEVVPGVTAGIAAPAYAGIPVTHRGVATSVTFITGSEDPSKGETQTDWAALARAGGTIVLYMGVRSLPGIVQALIAGGRDPETPAAAVEWGTHPRQRTVVATLATLHDRMREEGLGAPVITIVGDVATLRDEIAWLERRPLWGTRVVVTRAREQTSALAAPLRELGAEVIEAPATRLEPLDAAPILAAIREIDGYQWLVLTSQNGVRLFWDALLASGRDARALAHLRVACVGPSTAEALLAHGIRVDVMPERYVAEGVLAAMQRDSLEGQRVLYATAEGARDVLPQGLSAAGAVVDRVPLYRSVPDESGAAVLREVLSADAQVVHPRTYVALTSASAVHALVDAIGAELASRVRAVSIGPVTSDAARQAGIEVAAEADESTIPSLVRAIVSAASAMPSTA